MYGNLSSNWLWDTESWEWPAIYNCETHDHAPRSQRKKKKFPFAHFPHGWHSQFSFIELHCDPFPPCICWILITHFTFTFFWFDLNTMMKNYYRFIMKIYLNFMKRMRLVNGYIETCVRLNVILKNCCILNYRTVASWCRLMTSHWKKYFFVYLRRIWNVAKKLF